jgi:hypothetical protein
MGEIQQDPSMEEILASIKRVIAEDGRTAAAPARAPRRAPRPDAVLPPAPMEEDEPEDVLELDDPMTEDDGLLSDAVASASRQKLAVLSALKDRSEPVAAAPAPEGPLEALVRDMLRPMLKEWLDQHLPGIVEELVAREVARITGRDL